MADDDYPYAHVSHHSHHNHRTEDNENNINDPPPPPFFGGAYGHATPQHEEYQSYTHQQSSPYDQGADSGEGYGEGGSPPHHHRFQPHVPGFMGSHFHHGAETGEDGSHYEGGSDTALENKVSYKLECKQSGDRYCVGVREGQLVLTHPDLSDPTQHWCKDERYSTKVKDRDGYPSFILVNKGTGQAVKHSISCHPVQLTHYQPEVLDESVLWTESKDLGSGFRTIRTVSNAHLVFDAWNADKDHGGIHDGTLIALYEVWKGDNQNQQWKLTRH